MKRVLVAAVSLLLCLIVLISASFAWFSISRAPEISGIETNIGANGALEIALLTDETLKDPSLIRSKVGSSMADQEKTEANLYWGNILDLSDDSYGLERISLLPAKLGVFIGEENTGCVGSNLLCFANYGADGRVERQNMDSVSATYSEEGFIFDSNEQHYGVRGIGTIANTSPQQAALTMARSMVSAHKNNALAEAKAAWAKNGEGIIDICKRHFCLAEETFSQEDVQLLRDAAVKMKKALDYTDLALRQGIIGYAASFTADDEAFRKIRSTVENTAIPLSAVSSVLPESIPSSFSNWITKNDTKRAELQQVIRFCDAVRETCSWEQLLEVLNVLLDVQKAHLGQHVMASAAAYEHMGVDNILTISPESGAFADVSAFCGNYRVLFAYGEDDSVEVVTAYAGDPHLEWIARKLEGITLQGTEDGPLQAPLQEIYGYAIDVAFRCNEESDLLLQTAAAQRLASESDTLQHMGGGSHMRFTSENLDEEQMLMLIDAIRIGFVDGESNLAAVAKAGSLDYTFQDGEISAPVWLYEFEVSDSGNIILGERREEGSAISLLLDDTPMTMTVVVWLDGDYVFNSHAAISGQSMSGALNLQFASSAELDSADITVEAS